LPGSEGHFELSPSATLEQASIHGTAMVPTAGMRPGGLKADSSSQLVLDTAAMPRGLDRRGDSAVKLARPIRTTIDKMQKIHSE
jgi:hypothetical protein